MTRAGRTARGLPNRGGGTSPGWAWPRPFARGTLARTMPHDVSDRPNLESPAATTLAGLSQQLADVVDAVAPAVAALQRTRVPASATLWARSDAAHVLAWSALHPMGRHDEGSAVLHGGLEVRARLIAREPALDLALLELDLDDGQAPDVAQLAARWRLAEGLRVGELALTLGRGARGVRAGWGVVAEIGGAVHTAGGGTLDPWIDVDAVLSQGGSGGPLVSARGELLGLNTHGIGHGGATIPTATLQRAAERMLAGHAIRPGYLGVGLHPVALSPAVADATGRGRGALITALAEGGPAERGGLLVGDVIVALDEHPIEGHRELLRALHGKGGEEAVVHVVRGGALAEVRLAIGERPQEGMGGSWWRGRGGQRRGPWLWDRSGGPADGEREPS
jgi:S1-C subfamily serine protease